MIVLASAVRVLREYERGVIFRLGRLIAQKGPGLILLIPIIDKMVRVDLRTVTLSIPPQEVITRDNVPASVTAVCYFRVVNASDAIVQVENYLMATSQIAQTTLRAVLGRAELDTLLSERDRLNDELQRIIDEQTEPWGIKVTTVEIKDVEIPQTMQRAMARQAEAERERRAKIIAAEGEFQAADKLAQAAEHDRQASGRDPAALPPDADRGRLGAQLDHDLPRADRPVQAVPRGDRERRPARDDRQHRLSGSSRASNRPAHGAAGRAGARRARTGPSASSPPTPTMRPARSARCARDTRAGRRRRRMRCDPAAAPPDSPGWLVRAVPNKYPLLRAGRRADAGDGSAGERPWRPGAVRRRARPRASTR